jgi:hypothetical protein
MTAHTGHLPRRARARIRRAGYSIAALLLLTATIAVVLALLSAHAKQGGYVQEAAAVVNLIAGGVGGLMIGASIGASYDRRIRGFLLGGFIGVQAGSAAGFLSATRISLPLVVVGSLLLVALGAAFRWSSRGARPPSETPGQPPAQ